MKKLRNNLLLLFILFSRVLHADLLDDDEQKKKLEIKKSTQDNSSGLLNAPKSTSPLEKTNETQPQKGHSTDKKAVKSDEKDKNKKKKYQDNKNLPVHFKGEDLSGLKEKGIVEFHKNVEVTQGDLFMQSDFAEIHFNPLTNEVEKVIAKGKVKIRKETTETGESAQATSNFAEFDVKEQNLILKDNAELIKGGDVLKGNLINYNLKTGWVNVTKVKGLVKP
jgi:lipopolysaccharide transport protein LptA